jgi:hypothetical protein
MLGFESDDDPPFCWMSQAQSALAWLSVRPKIGSLDRMPSGSEIGGDSHDASGTIGRKPVHAPASPTWNTVWEHEGAEVNAVHPPPVHAVPCANALAH